MGHCSSLLQLPVEEDMYPQTKIMDSSLNDSSNIGLTKRNLYRFNDRGNFSPSLGIIDQGDGVSHYSSDEYDTDLEYSDTSSEYSIGSTVEYIDAFALQRELSLQKQMDRVKLVEDRKERLRVMKLLQKISISGGEVYPITNLHRLRAADSSSRLTKVNLFRT